MQSVTCVCAKVKVSGVYKLTTSLTATETRMPYGITRCYLPLGRADVPALCAGSVHILKIQNIPATGLRPRSDADPSARGVKSVLLVGKSL